MPKIECQRSVERVFLDRETAGIDILASMDKAKMRYFEQEDILYLAISDDPESGSIELSPNITAEYNDKGELIGIEILRASDFIRDSIVESVQAKVLHSLK